MIKKSTLILICVALAISVDSAPPEIHDFWHFPYLTEVDHNLTIRANVTDPDGDLMGVYLDVVLPNGTNDLTFQ